jgi:hypothetical protein
MLRELDCRHEGNDTISLYWNPERELCELVVETPTETRLVDVDPEDALDALHHPWLYAGRGLGLLAA